MHVIPEDGREGSPEYDEASRPPPEDDYISSFLDDFKDEWEQEAQTPKQEQKRRRNRKLKLRCTVCRLPTSSCTCATNTPTTTTTDDDANRCPICRLRTSSCLCDAGQGPMVLPESAVNNYPHDDDTHSLAAADVYTDDNPHATYDPHDSARQLDLLTATTHSSEDLVAYEDDSRSNEGLDGGMSMSSFGIGGFHESSSGGGQQQHHISLSSGFDRNTSHRSVTSFHSGSHESTHSGNNTNPTRRLDVLARSTHSSDGITPYEDDDDDNHHHHHNHHRQGYYQDSFVGNEEDQSPYPNNVSGAYDDSFLITDEDEEQGYTDVYADEGYDEGDGYGFHHRRGRGALNNHPGKAYLGSVDEMAETFQGDDDIMDDDDMTAHSYDRRKRWIPILLFCGGCLALVLGLGVGAGLGFVLTGDQGDSTTTSTEDDGSVSRPDFRPPAKEEATSPTISPTQAPTGMFRRSTWTDSRSQPVLSPTRDMLTCTPQPLLGSS